jgi:phage tail-like protein
MVKPQEKMDPYSGFRFLVEKDGLVIGGFSEVSGLSSETRVLVIKEGGVNDHVHKFPEATEYPNLILKRGLTDCKKLWTWYRQVANGQIDRATVSVILLDANGDEACRWAFWGAYPIKWIGPELKADSNAIAIEALEIAHNGFL